MKKVFLVLCLILFSQAVQAKVIDYAKEGFPPLQPARQNTVKTLEKNSYNKLNYNKVTQAEKTILGQTYENQHIDVRLNRLERSVFNRTYPNMSYEQRMNNIIVNYKNNNVSNDSAVSKKLGKMEKKVFNRQFANDTAENRISRLEEQIFGTIQSGDINSRYSMLTKAVSHYNTPGTFSSAIPDDPYFGLPPSSGGIRSLAGSFTNFMNRQFVGMPTGFSPQIYSPYVNGYHGYNGPYDAYNGYNPSGKQRFNGSYRERWGQRYGDMGAGVHILP